MKGGRHMLDLQGQPSHAGPRGTNLTCWTSGGGRHMQDLRADRSRRSLEGFHRFRVGSGICMQTKPHTAVNDIIVSPANACGHWQPFMGWFCPHAAVGTCP